jgi:lysophospholipase L1-like esterase
MRSIRGWYPGLDGEYFFYKGIGQKIKGGLSIVWQRVERMRLFKRSHIVGLFIFLGILLFIFVIEKSLHKKKGPENAPYELSFHTSYGRKMSWNPDLLESKNISGVIRWENPNSLILTLAPYAIYRNHPNQRTQCFTTNSVGLRGTREISSIKRKHKRIIVVGGSAAFGHGLENDNETFQAIIENLNNRYEVINAGVAGYCSGQELTYIVTDLVDYHPDIIIVFNGWNDLFWAWYNHIWHGQQRKKDEIGFNYNSLALIEAQLVDNYQSQVRIFNSFQRFFIAIVDRSLIISAIRGKIAEFKGKFSPFRLAGKGGDPDTQNADYFGKILNVYTKNLIKMNDFCHSQGIRFLVVFQPEPGAKTNITPKERWLLEHWPRSFNVENYEDEFPELYRVFIERSEEIITKNGVDFININTHPKYKNNPDTLFLDFIHTNKKGNEVIAHIINEYLNGGSRSFSHIINEYLNGGSRSFSHDFKQNE